MSIIHIINNEVSRAFVADGVLAYGGSPMMSENPLEFEALHRHSSALVINLGMIDPLKKTVIMSACKSAAKFGLPIGIDPVGIHISPWRLEVFHEIMANFKIAYVRGNQDEVYSGMINYDYGTDKTLEAEHFFDLSVFKSKLHESETVWLVTGEQDYILGCGRSGVTSGGTSQLRKISGAGCLLSALVAVNLTRELTVFDASFKASCDLKRAAQELEEGGIGTLKMKILNGLESFGDSGV